MERMRLPNRRSAETFEFDCENLHYTCTVGRFADGRIAELFVSNHKTSSQADANARDAAIVTSLALQHGVPLDTIREALTRNSNGSASTPIGVVLDLLAVGMA